MKLPPRMEKILLMACGENLKETEIARKLGISKQAVSKALREARGRLVQIFLTIADILNADIVRVNVEKGYAILRLRQTGQKAYIIYIPGKGPKTLFEKPLNLDEANTRFYEEIVEASIKWGIIQAEDLELPRVLEKLLNNMET